MIQKGTIIVNDGSKIIGLTGNTDYNVLVFDPNESSGVRWTSGPKLLMCYNATTEVSIDSGWSDITWDTQVKKDSIYTHSLNSAEVTINEPGFYYVAVDIGTYNSSGSSRSQSIMRFLVDSGSGYSEIGGTRGSMYNRNSAQGRASASVNRPIQFMIGDKFKVQAQRSSGTGVILTEANACRININKLIE